MKTKCIKCKNHWTDLEELKNKHIETNNTMTEIKNTLEGISNRIPEAEEWNQWAGRENGGNNFWRAD